MMQDMSLENPSRAHLLISASGPLTLVEKTNPGSASSGGSAFRSAKMILTAPPHPEREEASAFRRTSLRRRFVVCILGTGLARAMYPGLEVPQAAQDERGQGRAEDRGQHLPEPC